MKIGMYAKFNNVTIKKQQHVILRTNIRNQKNIAPPPPIICLNIYCNNTAFWERILGTKKISPPPPHPTHHMFGRLLQHVILRVDV